jgi:hypothetical protein
MKRFLCLVLLFLAIAVCAEDYSSRIAPLIDPAKLATLGKTAPQPPCIIEHSAR